jgi:hypothetical protein
MAGPYKALTYINLPVIEKNFAPGEEISEDDLDAANQTAEDIATLVSGGALGGMDDDINPQNIIPSPNMPTISSVVASAQEVVAQMTESGEEIPPELQAVADLDYTPVTSGDAAVGGDTSA